ncbi:MAG: hypothetical protein ACHQ51_15865 [Elusimicrobiota bacterium]
MTGLLVAAMALASPARAKIVEDPNTLIDDGSGGDGGDGVAAPRLPKCLWERLPDVCDKDSGMIYSAARKTNAPCDSDGLDEGTTVKDGVYLEQTGNVTQCPDAAADGPATDNPKPKILPPIAPNPPVVHDPIKPPVLFVPPAAPDPVIPVPPVTAAGPTVYTGDGGDKNATAEACTKRDSKGNPPPLCGGNPLTAEELAEFNLIQSGGDISKCPHSAGSCWHNPDGTICDLGQAACNAAHGDLQNALAARYLAAANDHSTNLVTPDGTAIIRDPGSCHTGGGFGNPDWNNAGCPGFEPDRKLRVGIANGDTAMINLGLNSGNPDIVKEATARAFNLMFMNSGDPSKTLGADYIASLTAAQKAALVANFMTTDEYKKHPEAYDASFKGSCLTGNGTTDCQSWRDNRVNQALAATYVPGQGSARVNGNGDIVGHDSAGNEVILGNAYDPKLDLKHLPRPVDPVHAASPGTPVPGSSDPRTMEQNAALAGRTMKNSSEVQPQYRGALMWPDGTITYDASVLKIPPARKDEIAAILAAGTDPSKPSGGYMLILNADGVPVQYLGVQPTAEMVAAMQEHPLPNGMSPEMLKALAADAVPSSQVPPRAPSKGLTYDPKNDLSKLTFSPAVLPAAQLNAPLPANGGSTWRAFGQSRYDMIHNGSLAKQGAAGAAEAAAIQGAIKDGVIADSPEGIAEWLNASQNGSGLVIYYRHLFKFPGYETLTDVQNYAIEMAANH